MPNQFTVNPVPLVDRILPKINKNGPVPAHCPERGPCSLWTGSLNDKGYGTISIRNRTSRVSRLVWEMVNGPIPDGLNVLHHCDNPPCVGASTDASVSHLFLGTHQDNARDRAAKGRNAYALHPERVCRGSRNPNSKLTEEIVEEIKRRVRSGERTVDVARAFKLNPAKISNMMAGRIWPHVP